MWLVAPVVVAVIVTWAAGILGWRGLLGCGSVGCHGNIVGNIDHRDVSVSDIDGTLLLLHWDGDGGSREGGSNDCGAHIEFSDLVTIVEILLFSLPDHRSSDDW